MVMLARLEVKDLQVDKLVAQLMVLSIGSSGNGGRNLGDGRQMTK